MIETSLPTGPLFTFRETFQTVSLVNQSAGSLALSNIQVVNTTPLVAGNQVTLDANVVNDFQFSVNHDFKPTTITVEETGQGGDIAPRIYVDGIVNNPIGVTTITNLHGDILTPPPAAFYLGGVIITDSFAISAPEGSIGSGAGYLQLDVVDSDDGPTDPTELFRTADAGTDVDLIIQGEYREGTEGGLPPSGYAFHIDRISAGDDANVILDDPVIETTVTPFAYEVRVDETVRGVLPGHPQPDDRRRSFPAGDARLDTDGASDGHLRDDDDDELHRPVRLRLRLRHRHLDRPIRPGRHLGHLLQSGGHLDLWLLRPRVRRRVRFVQRHQ